MLLGDQTKNDQNFHTNKQTLIRPGKVVLSFFLTHIICQHENTFAIATFSGFDNVG